MSIPPPSSGRRQPATTLTRMKRFWLGGSAAFLCVAGSFVVLSFLVPPTYESHAVVEVTVAGALDPKALVDELRSAIQESGRIEDLARHAEPGDDPLTALDRARRSFHVVQMGERAFSISYEGRRPESALHGAEVLLDATLEHFAHDAARRDEKQARADLEKRTKELADFVSLHPDFSPGQAAPRPEASAQPSRAASIPRDDPTLNVLREERARLEAKLATAQAAAAPSSVKNPYDEETDSDVATLGRQLAQVRLAIAAHQKAITERAAAPAPPSPEVAAEAARKASLDSEWKRLVRAVVDAQSAPPPDKAKGPLRTARVVEPPRLPTRPVKPNRTLVSFVGVLLGACVGVVWAFVRVNVADRSRRSTSSARERAPAVAAVAAPPGPQPAAHASEPQGSPDAVGLAATVAVPAQAGTVVVPTPASEEPAPLLVAAEPNRRALSPSPEAALAPTEAAPAVEAEPARTGAPAPEERVRPGLRNLPTQRGMIDAAFVKAQTGATPQSLAQRIEARPIVDLGKDRTSEPPPAGDRPSRPPPRSVTPPGPPSAPITQRIGTPNDPAERPSPAPRASTPPDPHKPDTSYSFVDRGWRATSKRASSRPPVQSSVVPPTPRLASPPYEEPRQRPAPHDEPLPSPTSPFPPHDDPRHKPTPSAVPQPRLDAASQSNRPGATKPGWARPSPPGTVSVSEVWTKVAGPREPPVEDVVEPRSVPPTWHPAPASRASMGGELSALCDKLTELSESKCVVVGVVSERPELDAKSETAAALASMVAQSTPRVLLMEANFDFPAVHRQMSVSMPNFSGFSQQMHARTRKSERKPWVVVRCSPNLDVLAEGIVRSPGVLYSQQFSEAVAELRRYYRVIVCDGPIIGGADAKPLDAVTDGLVVVGASQQALMSSLDRAAKWFGHKQLFAAVPAGAPPRK